MKIVKRLSEELTRKYGNGFSKRTVYKFLQFYKTFPKIVSTLTAQSEKGGIVPSVSAQLLSWSHYEKLLQVHDKEARDWYAKEAFEQTWSIRTLQRNISTQYYYRLLKSQDRSGVEKEMKEFTSPYQDKLEFIKNPIIAEFLGMQERTSFYESDLEQFIIGNLQSFIMELGKGYAFVARQQHIHTETDNDIARYSVLHGSDQLFASKYKLYLPTEEELRAEIEAQKNFYYLQSEKD